MPPAWADFPIRRGDSAAPQVGLRTEDPVSLRRGDLVGPGDVVRWTVTVGGAERAMTWDVSAATGTLVRDPRDPGLFAYPLTPAETAALDPGAYPFRIQVVRGDGGALTPLVGRFLVD